jgi:CPA2 family monovalent cation:H+ antiporter-2
VIRLESFLFQASVLLAAAVIAVPVAARLGLGSVLGYLLAGLVIGPGLGLVADTTDLQHYAEFGVVMMLFLIGLELEPRALWDMRHRLIGLGGLQITLTTGAVLAAVMAMGLPWQTALAVGLAVALSSTAIVLQTLNEKNLMRTSGGRSAFSVLLTQDIAVIPMPKRRITPACLWLRACPDGVPRWSLWQPWPLSFWPGSTARDLCFAIFMLPGCRKCSRRLPCSS